MIAQWFEMYKVLSSNALIKLLPPKEGLGDQVYVNSFCYLPTYTKEPTVILSNFTAEGRAGEEIVAGDYLTKLGYTCVKSPYKFEGEAELKYSGVENIYYGGYGIRTDIRTYDWLEEKYGIDIIRIHEVDPYLYHLDCNLFVISKDHVMVATEQISKKTLKQIEQVAEVHHVSTDAAYQGICNSLRVGDIIYNASNLAYLDPKAKYYKEETNKNAELEAICEKVGLELMYINLSEIMKAGALLSCCSAKLNYLDYNY
jgi:N-dimethylarginine dimethylaminohydrolase